MEIKVKDTTERLGYAPLGRLLLGLSLPGMASMITIALYNIIDTFWVARLGHEAIAALTIILPYHILIIAVAVGTGVGMSALTSRRFGERNVEAANHAAGQVFFLSIVLGGIFLISAVFFPRPLLVILGATPDIIDFGTEYLVIIGLGFPLFVFSIMANNLLRGAGDALRPMIFLMTGSVINIILDPFLILGIGPFPEMGMSGAALATVISQVIPAILGFTYLVARRSSYRIQWYHLKPSLPVIHDIYRVGLPSMLMEMGESAVFILFNNILSIFGSVAIAAAGIGFRIMDLAWMPIFGVSQGLLPIVGYSLGARLWSRLWRAVRLASIGLSLFLAVVLVPLELFAPQLIGIFSNDPELLSIGVPAMRIIVSTLFFVGPSVLFITTFQGLAKGRDALVLTLVRQFVFFVPLLFLLSRMWGLSGVWVSVPISDSLAFIVSAIWLVHEYKHQQRSGIWGK
jgi:putative MATE family efflux protein